MATLKTGHEPSFLFQETVLENVVPLIDDKRQDMWIEDPQFYNSCTAKLMMISKSSYIFSGYE